MFRQKPAMSERQELWWNWYFNSNEFLIINQTVEIPNLPLDEKISLISPSFDKIVQSMPETHANWLKWYKFSNLNIPFYQRSNCYNLQYYDPEPEITFREKRQILEIERVRQFNKVSLLLDDIIFIQPYDGEERNIRLQIKEDILREAQKERKFYPNKDGCLSGRYKYWSYRIDDDHKELLHPELIVMKVRYRQYLQNVAESIESFDDFCYRIQYEKACQEFKRGQIDVNKIEEDTESEEEEEEEEEDEVEEEEDEMS